MSDIIRLLPDSVANQIAAGEVIQRPASVIKELVENSVDAGATHIDIVLRDAGRTLIQVVDNGSGMSETDARMAFERHATSKIGCAADLFALRTMGFRGEALASIAAISKLDVRTARPNDQIGTRLIIEGSRVESQTPEAASAPGTNMQVKDLFFNVPARRRFLKKDATELANIMREFERLALVNPGVEFTITHNDNLLHDLRRGSLLQRIGGLFGKTLQQQLIPLSASTDIVGLEGFVSLPAHARRRGALQYLFVNGRNMRHPYFHRAIMTCFVSLLPPDAQPSYFINFTVDPASIDVNIHPTKNEIKFENEQAIWQILTSAVNESLGRYNAGPAIDFDPGEAPDIPAFDPASAPAETPRDHDREGYNPFDAGYTRRRPMAGWEGLYEGFLGERGSSPAPRPAQPAAPQGVSGSGLNAAPQTPAATEFDGLSGVVRQGRLDLDIDLSGATAMQVRNRYIVTQSPQGLMVIDQHRAHTLVLYHECLRRAVSTDAPSQRLMFDLRLDVAPSREAVLESLLPVLRAMGFELRRVDAGVWNIEGAPPSLNEGAARALLAELIESTAEHDGPAPAVEEMRRRVALKIATAGAIRSGQPLRADEMERITAALFALPSPATTPDGRRVFFTIDFDTLAKWLD